MPGARFSFGSFESEEQEIRDASEYAAALDEYQSDIQSVRAGENTIRYGQNVTDYGRHSSPLTTFRFILTVIERNPDSDKEKAKFYDLTKQVAELSTATCQKGNTNS